MIKLIIKILFISFILAIFWLIFTYELQYDVMPHESKEYSGNDLPNFYENEKFPVIA